MSACKEVADLQIPEAAAPLFKLGVKVGQHELKHRIVYAPLTRCRAYGAIPRDHMIKYYADRSTDGGLVISEGTIISEDGFGYPETPGIFTEEQVEAWKPIVQAVKDKGAVFFCQIWHVGRASHPDFMPGGVLPVSSSAIRVDGGWDDVYTPQGPKKMVAPRALELSEIPAYQDKYVAAAKNAVAAGFDGVEIHAANGYLLDQFTKSSANNRTDQYGGSIENRCRMVLETAAKVVAAVGADRVGIRLSPFNTFLDCVDATTDETFLYLVKELNKLQLAYIHVVEPRVMGNESVDPDKVVGSLQPLRDACTTTFISAGGHNRDSGAEFVRDNKADLICYGRHFLANPDMVRRFALGAELNKYDRATFYTQDPVVGYNDYPTLEEARAKTEA